MPSCNLLRIFAPLMGLAFLVAAAPMPASTSSFSESSSESSSESFSESSSSHNVSHTYKSVSEVDLAIALPSDYVSTVLFHHNVHRTNHSASPLTYSAVLSDYSTSLIQSCSSFSGSSFSGSSVPSTNSTNPTNSYSTNTYAFYSSNSEDESNKSEQTARAISTWYNAELETYVAASRDMTTDPVDYNGILHFSQVVWKDTTEVGCAALQCAEGTGLNPHDIWPVAWAVVCAYNSAGNCIGNACADDGFLGNVGSPLGLNHLGHEPWAS